MYLFLIFNKFLSLSLSKSNCHASNCMIVRSTLKAGEESLLDWLLQIVAFADSVENHSRSGASEGFVGGSGDNVAVFKRTGNDVGSDKAGNVSHVGMEQSAAFISNCPHSMIFRKNQVILKLLPFVVNMSRIARHSSNNQLWSEEHGVFFQLVVINQSGCLISYDENSSQMVKKPTTFVWHGFEENRSGRDLLLGSEETVSEMATVGEIQSHDSATRSYY